MHDRRLVAINHEAGDHAVPSDPRELAAAVRAGEESLRRVPYYLARYGERGRRFGGSDSAWLAALVELDQAHVDAQVDWLGTVLSARGMPRLLLEWHLVLLADTLAAAVPERAGAFDKLRAASARVHALRTAVLDDEQLEAIRRTFDASVGEVWRARLPEMGALLPAAVVDETSGVATACASVVEWAARSDAFPPAWIAAVHASVRSARAAIGRRGSGT